MHQKEKVPLGLPLLGQRVCACTRESVCTRTRVRLAYLKGQRLCLLKLVCPDISSCTFKMASFLETIIRKNE